MSGSELRVSDLKKRLKPIVDELLECVSEHRPHIEYLIDYALKELLYPKQRTAKDRIIKPAEVESDDRPCDTEQSDNLIKVDFSPDK
tara:strand:+ start:880 stop:1140 length:261 start_codon:yes stop_codon:yes gene_type:complete